MSGAMTMVTPAIKKKALYAGVAVADIDLANFIICYIRFMFDENGAGAQLAYFQLLSDMSDADVVTMLRLYNKRDRWSDYPEFVDELREVHVDDCG